MTAGRLLVVGTPIGNLGDLSVRGRDALASSDAIACEDTRRAGLLLKHFAIEKKPLLVANEHTEVRCSMQIIERLGNGDVVALTSDAGMPAVSDPGQRLIRAVVDAGFEVEVVPGPTAAVTALVASGLATDRFVFEGFLPRKGGSRRERLMQLADEQRTAVLYESPKRVAATLADLAEVCGPDRPAAVARELTKLHEEVARATLAELVARFSTENVRGEVVIVLGGASSPARPDDPTLLALLNDERERGSSTRDAVAEVMRQTGESKRRIYELATTHPD